MAKFLLKILFKLHFLQDISYYKRYFDRAEAIKCKNLKSILKIYLVQTLLLVESLYFLTFFLFQPKMSHFTLLICSNFFFMEGVSSFHNIWATSSLCMAFYLNHLMYFRNDGISSCVLKQLLLDQNQGNFFLN